MLLGAVQLELRGTDAWGDGSYGARRDGGRRRHNGVDYLAAPGTAILAPVAGIVTKLGYPYGDDLSFRYVEIRSHAGCKHRLFYVEPARELRSDIRKGSVVGHTQDLGKRYPGMPNHVHYEIKDQYGQFINPAECIC